ncbi:MAG: hypothetical protein MUQ26_01305 [Armatimonadetes bacterium]|nr:hypothetical protein [Armatimonadota bacterium]
MAGVGRWARETGGGVKEGDMGGEGRATCPRCGREHFEPEAVVCAECREALLSGKDSPGMGKGETVKVRVSPVLRDALVSTGALEDFDEALLRVLKKRHPEQATELLSAVTRIIELESQGKNEPREQTVRRLADTDPGPEVVLRTVGGAVRRTKAETTVIRINGKEYHSLDEVPAHLRDAVARGMRGEGKRMAESRSRPRVGCSLGLGSVLVALLLRAVGR